MKLNIFYRITGELVNQAIDWDGSVSRNSLFNQKRDHITDNFPEYMKSGNYIKGIFWDFDGTLVDSRQKNYNVTKKIVTEVTRQSWENFTVLKSNLIYQQVLRKSANWREFYQKYFSLTDEQTDYAGSLWTKSQLDDRTPVPVFNGIRVILEKFKHITHGIISQNSRQLIEQILKANNLQDYFSVIVGFEEVGIRQQKPDPAGLLVSITGMKSPPAGWYFYIGDHETDIIFAHNANAYFKSKKMKIKIYTIAAHYQPDSFTETWSKQPDFQAHSVSELEAILGEISGVSTGKSSL